VDGELAKVSSWIMRAALKLEGASPALRQAIEAMIKAVPQRTSALVVSR
jgi:hypothetical protein